MAVYRFVEPGVKGRRGHGWYTREQAQSDAVATARGGRGPWPRDTVLALWRSLERAGWRIEKVST